MISSASRLPDGLRTAVMALFAAELRAFRLKAGLSQEELGARLSFSPSLVAMVGGLRRAPTLQFAQRCDEAFDLPGTFVRLQQHARTTPLPSWFRPWAAEIEATATQLRLFEHSLVPGLSAYRGEIVGQGESLAVLSGPDLVEGPGERPAGLEDAGHRGCAGCPGAAPGGGGAGDVIVAVFPGPPR